MGCSASKDGVEAKSRSRPSQPGRSMSMPVQAPSNKTNNGYHLVALTSSTYGILKVDSPKKDAKDGSPVSKADSPADAFYEKLKHFDVPEEMVAKPWSEVSRSLPKIPPPTKTDSPRRTPRTPGKVTKTGAETINMWELMDGLDEDEPSPANMKTKSKPVERIVGSPVVKPFEKSVTFTTIHTLSELDSGDPGMAIAPGPAGNFLSSSKSVDSGGKENAQPVRVASSPRLPKRDEIVVKLTPSSTSSFSTSSPVARVAAPNSDSVRLRQSAVESRALTPQVAATIKEVSNALLPPPPSTNPAAVKSAGSMQKIKPPASHLSKSPMVKAVNVPVEMSLNSTSEAHSQKDGFRNQGMNSSGMQSSVRTSSESVGSNRLSHHASSPGRVRAVAAALSQDGAGAGAVARTLSAPKRVESTVSEPTREVPRFASPIHVLSLAASFDLENRRNSITPLDLKAPPMSPGPTTMKAGGSGQGRKQVFSKQQSMPSPSMRAVPFTGQGVDVRPQAPKSEDYGRPGALNTSLNDQRDWLSNSAENDLSSSYVHVSADVTPQKRKGMIGSPTVKGIPQRSKDVTQVQNGISPAVKGIPQRSKGVVQVQNDISPAKSPSSLYKRGANSNIKSTLFTEGIGDSSMDPDLLASFEEALEMFSADEWYNVRSSEGEVTAVAGNQEDNCALPGTMNGIPSDRREEAMSASGDKGGKANRNKEVTAEVDAWREANDSKSPAPSAISPPKKMKPDPWGRFEVKCPPAGEDRVVLYTTSLRGIRKTFEDCNNSRFIMQSFNVAIDERDVSIHAEFRQELKDLMGKAVPVPQAFIKGRYVGGMDSIIQLHEDGTLSTLVDGLPPQLLREDCDGCGGVRFVPCSDCSGSCKVINDANEVVRCTECNENGLMRCPICY